MKSYAIHPGVSPRGEPEYVLICTTPMFVRELARNSDRLVLERAIQHLTQKTEELGA